MSGTMELEEFLETLESLGKPKFPKETAKRLMAEQDREGSGSIDANEFGMIMLNEFCKTELPKGDLVDSATGKPWEIPATGQCIIQLSCNTELPSLFDIGQDYGIDNIIKSIREAKTDDQREILFQNTTSSPYFFLSFEQVLFSFRCNSTHMIFTCFSGRVKCFWKLCSRSIGCRLILWPTSFHR